MDASIYTDMVQMSVDFMKKMGKSNRPAPYTFDGAYNRRVYHAQYRNLPLLQGILPYSTLSVEVNASKSSFRTLQRTSMKRLRLNESARGKYLILRTIEPAVKMVSIMTLVEDHKGNVTLLSLYNFCADFDADPQEVLPIGTVFILKEPYIKVPVASHTLQSPEHCMLRCDCPTDIILLNQSHPLSSLAKNVQWKNKLAGTYENPVVACPRPKGADGWRMRGKALFQAGKINYAVDCYFLALQEVEKRPDIKVLRQVLHLNLASCYLRLGYFEAALDLATKVLTVEPESPKALFKAGKASYELKKYEEAVGYYQKLHEMDSENKEWKRTKERISEAIEGNVNMYRLCLERNLRPSHSIDCGDYVGPVKIMPIPGKGRGVVATEDIEPGRLLVVSKAFKVSWSEPNEFLCQFNTDKTVDYGDSVKLVAAIADAIAKNPRTFGPLVYDLSLGKHEAVYRDSLRLFCDPDTKKEPIADIQCIKYILNANAFDTGCSLPGNEPMTGRGLFIFPSYFNHSCVANAHWMVFNDVMIVRAVRFIRRDEEVSIVYFPPGRSNRRKEKIWQHLGFRCSCQLCIFHQQEPEKLRLRRDELMADFETNIKPMLDRDLCIVTCRMVRKLKRLIKALEATYTMSSEDNPCKIEMVTPYRYLQICYLSQQKNGKAIEMGLQAISCFGFDPVKLVRIGDKPQNWIIQLSEGFLSFELLLEIATLIRVYSQAGRSDDVKKWEKTIVALDELVTGGDEKCFKLNFPLLD